MQLSVKVLKQDYSFGTKAFLDSEERLSIFKLRSRTYLDCLQSAISLEIRPVLISSSAIANHDVIVTILQRKIGDCSQSSGYPATWPSNAFIFGQTFLVSIVDSLLSTLHASANRIFALWGSGLAGCLPFFFSGYRPRFAHLAASQSTREAFSVSK